MPKKASEVNRTIRLNPPPEACYRGFIYVFVGTLLPNTAFWCSPGGQHLSGVVLYQSIGSSTVRMRMERPITHEEYVDDIGISTSALVLVEEVEYEKQKTIHPRELCGNAGMEGFPKL